MIQNEIRSVLPKILTFINVSPTKNTT